MEIGLVGVLVCPCPASAEHHFSIFYSIPFLLIYLFKGGGWLGGSGVVVWSWLSHTQVRKRPDLLFDDFYEARRSLNNFNFPQRLIKIVSALQLMINAVSDLIT